MIWGTPYSAPAAKRPEASLTAFQSDTIGERIENETPSADILLSHGPPKGVKDGQLGSERINHLVERMKPMFHIFG